MHVRMDRPQRMITLPIVEGNMRIKRAAVRSQTQERTWKRRGPRVHTRVHARVCVQNEENKRIAVGVRKRTHAEWTSDASV